MTEPRKRAPGMSQEDRRAMIVQSALPLVAEYGAAVTTQQIARAAGIGEATIFRAFTDKDTLLRACFEEAVRPEHLVRELDAIPMDQELEPRLVEAAQALGAHMSRLGAVIGALGALARSGVGERPTPPGGGREASMATTTEALVGLLEPDAERFRLPIQQVASMFGFLVMSLRRVPGSTADAPSMVDVFLHGALAR